MSGININIVDMVRPDLEDVLNNLPSKAEEAMDAVDGIAEIIRGNMVSLAPFKWGDLREGHIVEETGPLDRYIFSDVPHFTYVVEGTPPHIIEGNPYLYWEGAEHPVRRVMHPGTAPNDYPSEALALSEGEIEGRLQQFLDDLFGS